MPGIVTIGLKFFSPYIFTSLRFLFGSIFCLIFLFYRYYFEDFYYLRFQEVLINKKIFFHLIIGGLLLVAIPNLLIAMSLKWISSVAIVMSKPIVPFSSSLFALCFPINEKFSLKKGISFLISVFALFLYSIPDFFENSKKQNSANYLLGYFFLLTSVLFLGFSSVYLKWTTSTIDITISSTVQTISSFVFSFFITLFFEGNIIFNSNYFKNGLSAFIWPSILGFGLSFIGIHAKVYLINGLGAIKSNLIHFGQIVAGIIFSILFLNEFKNISIWGILNQFITILLLILSVFIGIIDKEEIENKIDSKLKSNLNEDEEIQL